MGYDLAKIASELHLTSHVVEALEADDFREIGVRVFVRGYLRNYARIVGMPVESILRQFDEKWPDDTAHHSMVRESPTLPADGGPSRGLAGAMTWLVVIGLVVLFLMWWRGYLDEIVPEQIRSIPGETVSDGEISPSGLDAPGLIVDDPAFADGSLRLPAPPLEVPEEDDGALLIPPPADSSFASGETASFDPASLSDTSPTAVGQPFSAGLQVPAAPSAASGAQTTPFGASADLAVASNVPGAPVVEGSQQIVMSFDGACWVDVRDSERKFKLFGEMPAGTRKVLGGKPPYKLVIGNAQAVTISVNGRPYDISRHARGNVARFTLDP